jgi:hypothetical protein
VLVVLVVLVVLEVLVVLVVLVVVGGTIVVRYMISQLPPEISA